MNGSPMGSMAEINGGVEPMEQRNRMNGMNGCMKKINDWNEWGVAKGEGGGSLY